MDIETIFYNRDKVHIELYEYAVGKIDFKTNKPAVSRKLTEFDAIDLPQTLSKDWFKGKSDSKYEKGFVVYSPDFEIKPNHFIIYNNKRFNVKEIIDLPQNHYLLVCHSMANEKL